MFANFIILISSRRSGAEMRQQLGFGGSLLPVLPPDDRPCTTLAPPTPNLLLRTSTLAYPSCCHQYSLLLPPLPLLLPTYSFLLLVCPSTPSYFHHPCSYPPPTPTPTSVHPYPSYTHSSSTPIILSLLIPTTSIVIHSPFSSTSTCSTSQLSNHYLSTSFKTVSTHTFSSPLKNKNLAGLSS